MGRKNAEEGASVSLTKAVYAVLAAKHKEFDRYKELWRYKHGSDDTISISIRRFSVSSLKTLLKIYKDTGSQMGDRWAMGQIGAHIKVLESKGEAKIEQLRSLETAIIAWTKNGIIRGWVFGAKDDETKGVMQAMQLSNARYYPRVVDRDGTTPAYVSLTTTWWERNKKQTRSVSWQAGDALGKTVTELMTAAGLHHETQELIDLYDENEARFLEWRAMMGEQFVGHGLFEAIIEDEEERRFYRHRKQPDSEMRGIRLIVDDANNGIENQQMSRLFMNAETEDESMIEDYHDPDDQPVDRIADLDAAERFARLPLATFINCFNLSSYRNGWVHTDCMKPYVYRPELKEKLVLSPEHSELIGTLAQDMDVLMEDIISGKSGGTTILCQGKAGTGKTLTAEVYSEVIQRPLYRVHSGQLGTHAGSVEEALKKALENAMRWKAVLLIDEADVFISARGGDLEKNAVIGVFLRVLEYYNGLLFLTTNRTDDIDEAIRSRCIAEIDYQMPDVPERERLWITLSDVFGLKVVKDPKMARLLAETFECSGRDIKGLIKLVTKFSRKHSKAPTIEDFKRLSAFKKIKIVLKAK